MKYIQKFFLLVSLFILNLNAMSLSPTDKLSKTEEYLCKKIDSSLCGINQSYLDFHNYHKKVLHEVNFGTLTSEMENSLDTQTIQDIDTIRDLSGVYDLGGMLLAGIKYSKYYHLADQFEDQTLVPLTNIMESQNDLVWNREAQYYENQVSEFIKYKKDPYTEAIKNWKEIGRNAIDSYNQFKASADAAWSFSEATFLYSLEEAVNKVSKSAKATIDNSKALYQLVTDIVFPSIQLMEKSLKSELTLQDVSGMLEKLTALSKDLKNEDIKGANVLKAINIIDKILTSLKHKEASTRLYEKYKDDIFTNHIVGGIKASSRAELLINYSELLQFVVELTPENFNRLKKTTETIVNLIKAFGDYELKIRRVLHKDSLNDQYLSLLAKRMNISQTLYTRFMYGYFNEHMEDIINLDEYEYIQIPDTNTPEQKAKLFWFVPLTTTIKDNTIKAQIGDEIELKFTALGEDITEFVKEGIENGYKFYIWYDSSDSREKVELTLKSQSDDIYIFSFSAPKEEFNIIKLTAYNTDGKEYESFDFEDSLENIMEQEKNNSREYVDFNNLEEDIMVEINGGLIEDKYYARYLIRFKTDGSLVFNRLNLEKEKECKDKEEESNNNTTNQIISCSPSAIELYRGSWNIEDNILLIDLYDIDEFEITLKDGKLEKNMQLFGEDIITIYKAEALSLDEFSGEVLTFFNETGEMSYWKFESSGKLNITDDKNQSIQLYWSLQEGANDPYINITNNGETLLRLYNNQYTVGDLIDMYGYRGLLIDIKSKNNSLVSIHTIYLINETYKDYTIQTKEFIKEWTFDQDISNFDIEVVSNTYANSLNKDSFTKDGKTLKVNLSPDISNPINKLVLKFTKDGNPVKVNGSETFWSLTKTNHAPRLADGQITQLVSATDEPAVLDIETYDGDGDSVTLSVADRAGGNVIINGNRLTASFTDGKTEHTIKVALSDGKERVVKEFHVLQFDSSSIKDFYSDVSTNSSYPFDGIAFGTLKGVIWGQSDPDSPLKRIFRPTDDASMAEVLAMIVNAEKKAGLITLESSNYYMDVYPSWAMPYYTFARDYSAISQIRDLASYYPTREEIAKIIVKTLGLEDQIGSIALENSFEDEEDFSSNSMLYYAKIARFFGLFMTETKAKPKEHINRAELAVVIEKIFMIPDANISFDPATVEYGDNLIPVVSDIKAQSIDSNYNLVDNSKNVGVRYIYNDYFINAPIDTSKLLPSTQSVKALISNQNVKRLVDVPVTITFTDQDHDGVQDREDKWKDDPRYAFDTNKNNIPDILDEIYSLSDYNVNSIVNFDGQLVKVSDIIRDGTYIPDLDGDGIVDSEDTDDDNDGISDEDEIKYGLNPRDASDAIKDSDGDGISNIDEIAAKTDPNDKTSYPAQPQKMVKVELKRGWNLMGMDTNLSLAEIKSLIGDDNLYIIQGASKTYKKEYVDNDQAFLNDFEKFEEGKGYWIKVVKDVTFEYPQVRSKNLTIPLSKGWNLINPTAEMPVKAIQDQIGMQHLFIIQGASKTYKKEYLDNGQEFLNDFVKFEEPKGYWIKVDQDTVLEFTE